MDKRRVSRFSVGIVSPRVPKNFVGEVPCVLEMFWYQKVLGNRGNTMLSIFFSHSAEKVRSGTILRFKNFLV